MKSEVVEEEQADGRAPQEEDEVGLEVRERKRRKGNDGGIICRICGASSTEKPWGQFDWKKRGAKLVKHPQGDYCDEDVNICDWAYYGKTREQVARELNDPEKGRQNKKTYAQARRIYRAMPQKPPKRNFNVEKASNLMRTGRRLEIRQPCKTETSFAHKGVTMESVYNQGLRPVSFKMRDKDYRVWRPRSSIGQMSVSSWTSATMRCRSVSVRARGGMSWQSCILG